MALLATNKRKDEMKKVAEAKPRGAQFGEESKEEAVARATKMYVKFYVMCFYVKIFTLCVTEEDR